MTLADRIYQHSLHLPEPAAREVLSFVLDLEKRHGVGTRDPTGGGPPEATEPFLKAVAGTLDADFPDDIAGADLGVDGRREALD